MVNITEKSYIKVKWEGIPEEFTKEKQERIKAYFQRKYGCKNVTVQFNPITQNGTPYTLDQSENIYDLANQRKLIEQFIKENELDVSIEDIMRLDEKVNERMKQQRDVDYTYRKLKIKHIWFGPFLSFGPNNEFPIENLPGLTVINSIPHNFGGKTTATVDLLLYLFFNKTTKSKRDSELFNIFLPDSDKVYVKGLIEIDGVDFIIERTIHRKGKNNTTNSQLRIAKIINGVEENLSEEQRRESEKIITNTIGNYEDFLLTIIATSSNLEDLIDQKPTDRGNLLTRFIGLDIIKEKESICKEIKSEWEKNIKSNQYNLVDLEQEIENNRTIINNTKLIIKENEKKLETIVADIQKLNLIKEDLISKKRPIDDTLLGININEEKEKLQQIIQKGKSKKEEYQKLKDEFVNRVKPKYDEEGHQAALQKEKDLIKKLHEQKTLISTKEKEVLELKHAHANKIQEKEKELARLELAKERKIQEKEIEITNIERKNERLIQEKEKLIIAIEMEYKAMIEAKEKEVANLKKIIQKLKEDEICPVCHRKFDDRDNSEAIAAHELSIEKLNKEIEILKKSEDPRIKSIKDEIDKIKVSEDPDIKKLRVEIETLKTIDSPEIIKIRDEINILKNFEDPSIKKLNEEIKYINEVIIPSIEAEQKKNAEELIEFKKQFDELNQYEKDEIKLDRLLIEMKSLAQEYKEQEDLIKRYEQNELAIAENKKIEKEIIDVNFKIEAMDKEKDEIIRNQQVNEDKIKNSQKIIDDNEKLIKIINKEQETLKIFEYYLMIFGKKGIASLILKSAIPIINAELDRLLSDSATFTLELEVNNKNDVEYWMIDRETGLRKLVTTGSGYERTAAALALRAVLTKISVLPKPDLIVFDEVLGKVADENLDLMKNLLDKITEMFDKVFMITHNTLVKDWGDNVITIEKIDNISYLKFNKNISKVQVY